MRYLGIVAAIAVAALLLNQRLSPAPAAQEPGYVFETQHGVDGGVLVSAVAVKNVTLSYDGAIRGGEVVYTKDTDPGMTGYQDVVRCKSHGVTLLVPALKDGTALVSDGDLASLRDLCGGKAH